MTDFASGLPEDIAKRQGIAQVRRVASLILLVLSVIFVTTHFFEHLGWPVLLLQSMAEAGMIGGLADWFAIEALFRRPLGLPIPHTALLPANQNRAAENVGRFFETYFLEPGIIRTRIIELRPARYALAWLIKRRNARQVASYLIGVLEYLVGDRDNIRFGGKLKTQIKAIFKRAALSKALAAEIATVLNSSTKEDLTDNLLAIVRSSIASNRNDLVTLVQDRSRWWIASRVDREVANRLTDAVLSVIDDLMDPSSKLRADFDGAIESIISQMADNGTLETVVSRGKEHFLESGAFDDLAASILHQTRDRIAAQVRHNPDALADDLAQSIRAFAIKISREPETLQKIEQSLADAAEVLIRELKPVIGVYVSDMIGSWEPEMLVDRFEVEVGRDLQFIRINGSVLGAAIGGAIFGVSAVLH